MSRASVTVAVYDTDAATWKALAQAFEPMSGDTATWVRITDAATGIAVTFFKSHDSDAEWSEDDDHGAGCATHGSSAAECTCGKADALAEASA
jgi:hypothetical protein